MEKPNLKAAIYCRLSEEDQNKTGEESNSIQNQKILLTQYAQEQGWEIYHIYIDDNYTGTDRTRPAFLKLLSDAEKRCFDIVLCKSQSRFTREIELVEKYIHGLFPLWNIRFLSLADHMDSADNSNKKSRQLHGLINEWYLEDLSQNIKSVLDCKRKNGLHIGAFAPYGYQKDPQRKGHLIIDPKAAAIVLEIFSLYANGWGKAAIARFLNEQQIPNPTSYKQQQGFRYRQPGTSPLWRADSISAILKNPVYHGDLIQGKYGSISYKTKKNKPRPKESWYISLKTHEAIVPDLLWEQVEHRLCENTHAFPQGKNNIFSGKVRCACCGKSLYSIKNHGKKYLRCLTPSRDKNACIGAFISVDALEQAVLEQWKNLVSSFLDRKAIEALLTEQETSSFLAWQIDYKKQLELYEKTLLSLYLDKEKGTLSQSAFLSLSQNLLRSKQEDETKLRNVENQLSSIPCQIKQKLDALFSPEQLSKEMVLFFIDHISVGKRCADTDELPVSIFWNF